MAPVRAAVGVVVLVLVFLGGVWSGLGLEPDRGTTSAVAGEGGLRPSEVPGPDATVSTGHISFRVLGWRCGITPCRVTTPIGSQTGSTAACGCG